MSASPVQVQSWGRISYQEAWKRQLQLVDDRSHERISDQLVFCEHDAVITLGRGFVRDPSPLTPLPGTEVLEVERGGLATYHGPGQLVIYPIFKLGSSAKPDPERSLSIVGLIRNLELWVSDYLNSQGMKAGTVDGKTGVWVDNSRKIASIGLAARRWISYHGLALNVSTGPEAWTQMNPCGFEASVMTSVSSELGRSVSVAEVQAALEKKFAQSFAKDLTRSV